LEEFVDIVLGVSLTPKTVRLVLVEGVKGDGAIVDHDTFDVSPSEGSAKSSASAQVVAAVLGTLESAREGGHQLKAIGVTWSDHAEAAELRDALAASGVDDAILVSELHAAGALAQTAGRAVGYESTGLLFLDRDTATLSVVRTDDGSIVKVLSRSLHSTDAMAVLTDMASAVAAQDTPPQGMFVVGSGVDVASVKSHLQDLVSIPVNAPEESGLALARGAAIAAANAPIFDASTVGLAYSQDPDGPTAGNDYPILAGAETQIRAAGAVAPLADDIDFGDFEPAPHEEGRKPFLLVGSALTSVFVLGVVALVISLAVSIRPTADQRPDPGQSAILPSAAAPAAPLPEAAPAPAPAPAAAPPAPPAETIQAPIPVVQQEQAPKRQVYVAPAPEAPPAPVPDPPAAPPPDPVPAAAPPVPAVIPPMLPQIFNPVPQQPSWQQYPQQYPQYPQQQYPQYPQYPQQNPWQPPQQQNPWQQEPQNPWQPGGGNGGGHGGWPGGGNGGGRGGGGGGGGGGGCFLIFCAPGGGGRH
jgi:uncharacterized membrane protein YgcG